MNSPFSKLEKQVLLLLGVLLIASFFINIGEEPLYLEEPRRAMVAAEMEFQDNLIVPTHLGNFYYRKPPLFNWVVLTSLRTFPQHPETFFFVLTNFMKINLNLKIEESTWYYNDVYTASVNLAGLPGMSVPCGFGDNDLPVGVQLIAPHFEEQRLFNVGQAIEENLDLKRFPDGL